MAIKVQLVGPMTGYPNFNYDAFDEVEQHISRYGLTGCMATPVNPALSFDRRQDLPRHQYLASSLKQVGMADALCLLPGWDQSEGARLEVTYALELGEVDFYLAWRITSPRVGWATGYVSRETVESMLDSPVAGGHAVPILGVGTGVNDGSTIWVSEWPPYNGYPNINAARRAAGLTELQADADGFVVSDSGVRQEYASGMRRDTQEGKPDYTLIDRAFLYRWAMHMVKGKAKYGEDNWRLADSEEELKRFQKSALRHLMQWLDGEDEEDHAAAVAFNVAAAEYVKDKLKAGKPEPKFNIQAEEALKALRARLSGEEPF